jgi:hypothetical protein
LVGTNTAECPPVSNRKKHFMELILVLATPLLIAGVAYASTSDLHYCTRCRNSGSDDFGMMQMSQGKKTLFNPRGRYWAHTQCARSAKH